MVPDNAVRRFQEFLRRSWSIVGPAFDEAYEDATNSEDARLDWLQANWENLVEVVVCNVPGEILEVYGEGAECNSPSSRVWLPNSPPTHEIVCCASSNQPVLDVLTGSAIEVEEFVFGQFVGWNDTGYFVDLPFDHVLLELENDIAVVNALDVSFELRPIR